jgi:hypothetical protein
MTLYQIWDLASYIAGKFSSGGSVPPARLNFLLPQVSDEYFLSLMNEIVAASVNDELLNKILSTTPLRPFKKSVDISASSGGVATLPTDYNRYITLRQRFGTDGDTALPSPPSAQTKTRRIDIVSEEEFARRQGSIFTRGAVHPFAKVSNTAFMIVPYDIGSVNLEYFRPATIPFFDWCQDATNPNKIIFMPVGSRVYLDDALSPNLYDSNDVLLYTGVTKSGTYPIASQTVELEFESQFHHRFVYFILTKIGINLSEELVAKYALEMSKT